MAGGRRLSSHGGYLEGTHQRVLVPPGKYLKSQWDDVPQGARARLNGPNPSRGIGYREYIERIVQLECHGTVYLGPHKGGTELSSPKSGALWY